VHWTAASDVVITPVTENALTLISTSYLHCVRFLPQDNCLCYVLNIFFLCFAPAVLSLILTSLPSQWAFFSSKINFYPFPDILVIQIHPLIVDHFNRGLEIDFCDHYRWNPVQYWYRDVSSIQEITLHS
jgi:hypothetical protein